MRRLLPLFASLGIVGQAAAFAAPARADVCCPPPKPACPCDVVKACDPCAKPWKFALGLNASLATGNTESFDLKFDGEAIYDKKPWVFKATATTVYGEASGTRNKDNTTALLRFERSLGGANYLFAQLLFETDDFASLDYRITPVAGYGRALIHTPRTELKGEVGGGAAIERRAGLEETTDPIAWIALHFVKHIGKEVVFKADLDVRPNLADFDRTVSVLDLRLESPLCTGLFLVAGARFRHEVNPPGALEELDTLLTLGLRLQF